MDNPAAGEALMPAQAGPPPREAMEEPAEAGEGPGGGTRRLSRGSPTGGMGSAGAGATGSDAATPEPPGGAPGTTQAEVAGYGSTRREASPSGEDLAQLSAETDRLVARFRLVAQDTPTGPAGLAGEEGATAAAKPANALNPLKKPALRSFQPIHTATLPAYSVVSSIARTAAPSPKPTSRVSSRSSMNAKAPV